MMSFTYWCLVTMILGALSSACNVTYTDAPGLINSPNYPMQYPSDIYCTYLVIAPEDFKVLLTIDDIDLEHIPSVFCMDKLILYDGGQEIGEYCENPPTPIRSDSQNISLTFITDPGNSGANRGFNATFEFVPNPLCGTTITEGPGNISSPHYPLNYLNNECCEITILAPKGQIVQLDILDFEVEHGVDCDYDRLSVYEIEIQGNDTLNTLGEYCGNITNIPHSFTSSHVADGLVLILKSDSSVTRRGFHAQFEFVQNVSDCNSTLNSSSGSISSPNHPGVYPLNTECHTLITAASYNTTITLSFVDFQLQPGLSNQSGCHFDSLKVYDGNHEDVENLIGIYCGSSAPSTITSISQSLYLVFQSDSLYAETGFLATYQFYNAAGTPSAPTDITTTTTTITTKLTTSSRTQETKPMITSLVTTATGPLITSLVTTASGPPSPYTEIPATETPSAPIEIKTPTTTAATTKNLSLSPRTQETKRMTTSLVTTNPTFTPVYPKTPDNDTEKKVAIEIKVLVTPVGCLPNISESSEACEDFKRFFIIEVSPYYNDIDGLRRVEVLKLVQTKGDINLFAGTIYVSHEVVYGWNDMNPAERGLTADDIYDMTVADGIAIGLLGNLTVGTCTECQTPQETTQPLCTTENDVTCDSHKYLDPYCIDGIPVCQSPCLNTDNLYCGSNGVCSQESVDKAAQCSCIDTKDSLYFGEFCHLSINKWGLYVGVPAAVLIIIVLVIVYLVISKKKKKVIIHPEPENDNYSSNSKEGDRDVESNKQDNSDKTSADD